MASTKYIGMDVHKESISNRHFKHGKSCTSHKGTRIESG